MEKSRYVWVCPQCKITTSDTDPKKSKKCAKCKITMLKTDMEYNQWSELDAEKRKEFLETYISEAKKNGYIQEETKKNLFSQVADSIEKTFVKKDEVKVEVEEKTSKTYLDSAEKAAAIVEKGLQFGNLAEMNQELNALSVMENTRERFVFDNKVSGAAHIMIILSAILCAVYVYGFYIGEETLRLSDEFNGIGLIAVISSSILFLLGVLVIYICNKIIRFGNRYKKYTEILRYKYIEIVDDLSVYAKESLRIVEKDLAKAVKMKLIPEGHFGTDNNIFIVADNIYDKYLENQAAYDRYYRKLIEERARMKERSESMQKLMDTGEKYIKTIHQSNDIIKDKIISDKLDRMESVVSMIFHEVDINPSQVDNLGLFIDYYLPTTQKLLEAYIDIDESKTEGKNAKQAKSDIEETIDTINIAFENILDRFYQEQQMDIASDISAMEIIMQQEGLGDE